MAKDSQIKKGLPKRVRNEAAKAKRARSWAKNQRAKAIRIAEQAKRKAANDEYRARGELTPYEQRQRARRK